MVEFVYFDTKRIMYVTMKHNVKQRITGHVFELVRLATSLELV